jgi:hypothetical protein
VRHGGWLDPERGADVAAASDQDVHDEAVTRRTRCAIPRSIRANTTA